MAAKSKPTTTKPSPIPLPYRLFFTWIEPLSALFGAYLYLFAPTFLLPSLIPTPLHPLLASGPSPVETMLLWQVGSLYIVFFFVEFVFLRYAGSGRPDVWRIVVAAILFGSDWGHIWSFKVLGEAAGMRADWWWWPGAWERWEDWGNLGTLWFGVGMRVAFLLGVGL
ncbi:hypothetical protein B0J12DRAFT_380748 [Macrophomina phaseolina]|uniref:DUF7704 domain-containing protein n=1 Tax=Macrophomina phaseolina TaxID=35725 RepID=A0ABQ8GKR6_9PEZI|nr:hypothetical protein B0J12DRAFT_380748 [Macrophomina phaseolina]